MFMGGAGLSAQGGLVLSRARPYRDSSGSLGSYSWNKGHRRREGRAFEILGTQAGGRRSGRAPRARRPWLRRISWHSPPSRSPRPRPGGDLAA
ncbi:hypothetical protein I79_024534 [Cricetulus griseus]|uniref:Uncharacterized protein n=1 Tax=Cricetulus griseus TaxID=10029 RepID=G3IKX9_CRIGR|nr:hypothetical protein I79_024534 [Cricetulus griseus]